MKYIFVHIPKTGGTSFRLSIKEKMTCLWDYGPNSKTTSDLIKKTIYDNQESLLADLTKEKGFEMISGHFSASKYRNIYPQAKLVTFIREPVSRVISEYNHAVRHGGYTHSIEKFCCQSRQTNKQYLRFEKVNIEEFYFIGITEYYTQSLQIFNQMTGLDLEELKINLALQQTKKRSSLEVSLENLDRKLIDCIKEHNQRDVALYESVKKIPYLKSVWHTEI